MVTTRPVRLDPTAIAILDQAKGRLRQYGNKRPSYNAAVRLLGGEPISLKGQGRRGRELIMVGIDTPTWMMPRLAEQRRRA